MTRRGRFDKRGALALAAASWGLEFLVGSAQSAEPFEDVDGIAVVDISGPLTHHPEFLWDSYDAIKSRVSAALESSCTSVVLKINSPGGDVSGVFETARELRALAAGHSKTLYAYVDGLAASAGYALACCADGGVYVPETGRVGSIGVINVFAEQTVLDRQLGLNFAVIASGARKADGNPHVPISEEAIAEMQSLVDGMADLFFAHVAACRPLSVEEVRAQEAAVFFGRSAVEAGLADGVTTFDELLAMVASGQTTSRPRAAAEETTMTYEEAIAALKTMSEGDGDDADKAKKAMKAIDGVPGTDKKDDEPAPESKGEKAAGADDKSKCEDKKDEPAAETDDKDKDAKAATGAPVTLDLVAEVQRLSAEVRSLKQDKVEDERTKLLASRPDFAPELVTILKKAPLALVRDAVKNVRPPPTKKDPAAEIKAKPTRGAGQGDQRPNAQAASEAESLKERMGLTRRTDPIRRTGTEMHFGVMTREDAQRVLAKKEA